MPRFIYFPKESLTYNGHHILYQTGTGELVVSCEDRFNHYIWLKMRGEYYPIDRVDGANTDVLVYFRRHINGYRKYRSKYWEFIQDKKANCENWEAEQLAFQTWEFPDLETENVEARLPRNYEEPRNLIFATFEEPHVFYIFNPPEDPAQNEGDTPNAVAKGGRNENIR